jgi:ADP-heptose:LPS heptosyltransferase
MTPESERVLLVLPEIPGDLVCCRYAVRLFADKSDVTVVIRKTHLGLIAGLPVQAVTVSCFEELLHDATPGSIIESSDFQLIVDLHGDQRTAQFVSRLSGWTVGFSEPEVGITYKQSFPWRTSTTERVHLAVRHARAVPGYHDARMFDVSAWTRSWFRPCVKPCFERIAMCPGSSLAGKGKRVSPHIWRTIAEHLRASGRQIVWFLGPDEKELLEILVLPSDSVQSGSFDSVVAEHSSCEFGITHDTVHLHIRAHLPLKTCAVFVLGGELEWGGYPIGISVCNVETSAHPSTIASSIIRCFQHASAVS